MTAEPAFSRRHKILVADDEHHLRRLLSITLRMGQYEILEAATGAEALALAHEEHPDLVLLDVRMPDGNGLEVCRRMKADPGLRDTPVVMISALALPADLEAGRAAGADLYITKPFSPLRLVEVVTGLLSP